MGFQSSCNSLLGVDYWVGCDRQEFLTPTPCHYLPDEGTMGVAIRYVGLLLCLRLAVLSFPGARSSYVDPR